MRWKRASARVKETNRTAKREKARGERKGQWICRVRKRSDCGRENRIERRGKKGEIRRKRGGRTKKEQKGRKSMERKKDVTKEERGKGRGDVG